MFLDFLMEVFKSNEENEAIIWHDRVYTFHWLLNAVDGWTDYLKEKQLTDNSVVSLEADFSPNAVALLLALIKQKCIIVPLTD